MTTEVAALQYLAVEVDPTDRVVWVVGEMDAYSSSRVSAAVFELQRQASGDIELALEEVVFIDAGALNVMVRAYRDQLDCGAALLITGIDARQRRIFRLGGVEHLLPALKTT